MTDLSSTSIDRSVVVVAPVGLWATRERCPQVHGRGASSGMSEADILRNYPDLEREDIRACLELAADRERGFPAADA